MKILLVAYEFAPQSTVASVRPTKLYKYWKRSGHEVTVLTARKELGTDVRRSSSDEVDYSDVISIDCNVWFKKPYEGLRRKFANRSSVVSAPASTGNDRNAQSFSIFVSLKRAASSYCTRKMFSAWVRNSKKYLSRNAGKYDLVFSTFGPKPSVDIGEYAKKINPDAMWVADFRDPPKDKRQQIRIRHPQNYVRNFCSKADLITAVSSGCMNELHLPAHTPRKVVTNGYDWDDRRKKESAATDKFTFVVTGNIYRDDSYEPLFRICADLIGEGVVGKDDIVFRAAGWNLDRFTKQAAKYGLSDNIDLLGMIIREDAITLQSSAHILLVETWNTEERQGVIGGKIFEYMTSEIPVAVMVNGDKKGSAIASLINECGLGFCYEFAEPKDDELKTFIIEIYRLWKSNEKYTGQNWEKIKMYDYKRIAEEILTQALGKAE